MCVFFLFYYLSSFDLLLLSFFFDFACLPPTYSYSCVFLCFIVSLGIFSSVLLATVPLLCQLFWLSNYSREVEVAFFSSLYYEISWFFSFPKKKAILLLKDIKSSKETNYPSVLRNDPRYFFPPPLIFLWIFISRKFQNNYQFTRKSIVSKISLFEIYFWLILLFS